MASDGWREWGKAMKSKMEIGRWKMGRRFAVGAQGKPFASEAQGKLVRDCHGEW